jgi:hypothetical protein
MVEEALHACAEAVSRPLSFSPEGVSLEEAVHSPVYTPSAANWNKLAKLNEKATALGLGNIIHFGPGVQQELDDQMITCGITRAGGRYDACGAQKQDRGQPVRVV